MAAIFPELSLKTLKLPAASCRESSILKEVLYSNRSLTPQQATGNALAPGFTSRFPVRSGAAIRRKVAVKESDYETTGAGG
jgi:hypothetical protein